VTKNFNKTMRFVGQSDLLRIKPITQAKDEDIKANQNTYQKGIFIQ
jgi:hypothetical protein